MELIRFEDVTSQVGITFSRGLSAGSSWGDFNGDSLPDLYVSNHFSPASLYLNLGDGTFRDIASDVLSSQGSDTHAVGWADFDNDGDQDLIQFTGAQTGQGSEQNYLFVNNGNRLIDQAITLGVTYPSARSRTPLWYDYDNDGLLDIVWSSRSRSDRQAPPTIFRQTPTGFEDVRATTGFNVNDSRFSFLSDLSGDGRLDLIVGRGAGRGLTIYDTTTTPFIDISADLLPAGVQGEDVVSADFNGDLLPDLYLTRSGLAPSEVVQDNTNALSARFQVRQDEKGVQFDTDGDITFAIRPFPGGASSIQDSDVFIGSSGLTLSDITSTQSLGVKTFSLSPSDPNVQGIYPHTPGIDRGVFIGYDPIQESWQLLLSGPNTDSLATMIQSTTAIDQLNSVGFDNNQTPLEDFLLINTDQGLVDRSEFSGINAVPNAGTSVTSGDFDNDMDVDIYVAASGPAANRPNILYKNQGDGTFIASPDNQGAAGTDRGVISTVTTADYDLNGFLDLFLTTAEWPPLLVDDGPHQLLRNQGNSNHWLQIDLEGIVSNRDGIGAQIFATAGGITQLREQSGGGAHFYSQNHQRIHFGLAEFNTVEKLEIRWPSGIVQTIEDIPANQLIKVIEPSEAFQPGESNFTVGEEEGVFLWKETFDGPYHLRTNGKDVSTQFSINLISTQAVQGISSLQLEPNDQLSTTEFGFSFESFVVDRQDGIDFQLAPGASGLLSISQDGITNPRILSVGSQKTQLSPAGWILNSDDFPGRPSFDSGKDLGLFVGQGSSANDLEFRWNGDGNFHQADLTVLAAESRPRFTPVDLDGGGIGRDTLLRYENGVSISGTVGTLQDGLDITLAEPIELGFSYKQDNLVQSHRVNPFQDQLGLPNAYELPIAKPFGQPDFVPAQESGLFLWKDEQNGIWHLRATAGGNSQTYKGSIIADRNAILAESVLAEPNDTIDISNPLKIDFELNVLGDGQDGIDFQFPDQAALSINIDNGPNSLRIGANKWTVNQVPLDLSGW